MQVFTIALLSTLLGFAASQSLVLIGGALSDDNDAIYSKIVELAGGPGVARFGVFTMAAADPPVSADLFINLLVNVYGAANATFIPVTETSNNADDPAIADLVREQTGFFFCGGDQLSILIGLRPGGRETLALTAMKDTLKAGAVIAGTSAGAMCLSDSVVIIEGKSWNALVNGSYIGDPSAQYPKEYLTYDEHGALGFLPGWVIDSHMSQRGRESRLIRLLQDTRDRDIGTPRGIGIDEDMAVVVTDLYTKPVGKVTGKIAGGAFFADVTDMIVYPSANTHYENATVHYLTQDDSIDFTTGQITYASWKGPLKGNEHFFNSTISNDILSSKKKREWASAAANLFDNQVDDIVTHFSNEKNPQFEITFNRLSGIGYAGHLPSDSSTFVVSHENLLVSIKESL